MYGRQSARKVEPVRKVILIFEYFEEIGSGELYAAGTTPVAPACYAWCAIVQCLDFFVLHHNVVLFKDERRWEEG